jgi:hypothetical protein
MHVGRPPCAGATTQEGLYSCMLACMSRSVPLGWLRRGRRVATSPDQHRFCVKVARQAETNGTVVRARCVTPERERKKTKVLKIWKVLTSRNACLFAASAPSCFVIKSLVINVGTNIAESIVAKTWGVRWPWATRNAKGAPLTINVFAAFFDFFPILRLPVSSLF